MLSTPSNRKFRCWSARSGRHNSPSYPSARKGNRNDVELLWIDLWKFTIKLKTLRSSSCMWSILTMLDFWWWKRWRSWEGFLEKLWFGLVLPPPMFHRCVLRTLVPRRSLPKWAKRKEKWSIWRTHDGPICICVWFSGLMVAWYAWGHGFMSQKLMMGRKERLTRKKESPLVIKIKSVGFSESTAIPPMNSTQLRMESPFSQGKFTTI